MVCGNSSEASHPLVQESGATATGKLSSTQKLRWSGRTADQNCGWWGHDIVRPTACVDDYKLVDARQVQCTVDFVRVGLCGRPFQGYGRKAPEAAPILVQKWEIVQECCHRRIPLGPAEERVKRVDRSDPHLDSPFSFVVQHSIIQAGTAAAQIQGLEYHVVVVAVVDAVSFVETST